MPDVPGYYQLPLVRVPCGVVYGRRSAVRRRHSCSMETLQVKLAGMCTDFALHTCSRDAAAVHGFGR
jgi:hypothetical protein